MYILDSNFLIDAKNLHFPFSETPEFWNWLIEMAKNKSVIIPEEVYKELEKDDDLAQWLKKHKGSIITTSKNHLQNIPQVAKGYFASEAPNQDVLDSLKADPYTIAHAIAINGSVVTSEKPNNATKAKNKQIPNICTILSVPCLTFSRFMWEIRAQMN